MNNIAANVVTDRLKTTAVSYPSLQPVHAHWGLVISSYHMHSKFDLLVIINILAVSPHLPGCKTQLSLKVAGA